MQLMQMRFEFTYDVDGLRTSKKIPNVGSEHKYYYVGSRLQYETLSDDSVLYYFYDSDGNPSGIRYKTGSTFTDYYYVCNWRGDVVEIYNSAGVLVASYDYNAWGVTTTHSTDADTQNIADLNPLRYRGYYYDSETSMYYVNSRYYDPATKRFLNSDDDLLSALSPESLTDKNYFAYCDNNPVTRIDDDGEVWHIIAGAVIGGVLNSVGDIIGVVKAYQSGENVNQAWLHLGISFASGAAGGALSMSAIGTVASISINAAVSLSAESFDQIIDKEFNAKNLIVAGIEGALGGIDTGGALAKSARKAGSETIRKTYTTAKNVCKSKGFKAAVKAYAKKAAKQSIKYIKNTKSLSIKLIKANVKSFAKEILKNVSVWAYKKWVKKG